MHAEYSIRRKIVRTTTDNGLNFVKAFAEFSNERSATAADSDDVGSDDENDDDDDEVIDPVDVYLTLNQGESDSDYLLPPHQRCTLNLIATTDAETAESDPAYKIFRSTFGKCQGLWNKYGRSAMAVEAVNDVYSLGLKRPNLIRRVGTRSSLPWSDWCGS